ncbi:hypothetical protein SERLA73DRAFT_187366 [Serpula lacrymans var. lacrymans S7.3]|uniref:Uncharacterized protein n=2 Tax=Serpula lacrymans var. lacrymans TaxID=341189 RepID=F8Q921_SERL3|nr:uncharacterized protein SERLADRAFT_476867 [Serpula lacrymans var. lacrymans S7.9]EGN95076.1 hypothetical protein SERLA73DRAFT_187366 [Serpula lacrymans var. lacrymans S7.3]EGO20566.1 hypothetical protein SERLADRAFT_476867 [Serpula lacrymans var. lacrymans S7.9]
MIPQNPYSRMKGTHKLPAVPSPNLPAPSPLSLYERPPVGVKSGLQRAPFLPLAEPPVPVATITREESALLPSDDVQINPSTPKSSVNQSHQSQKPCSISSTTCKRDFTPYFAFEREQQERESEREQGIPPSLSRTTRVHG